MVAYQPMRIQKKIIYSTVSCVLFLISLSATVFDETITATRYNFRLLTDPKVQEKVHLHLDKRYYVAGDNIWFKAYVLDEHSLAPSAISNVLYVDLIHKNNLVKSLKLPIENGIAWGDFKLSDSIPGGSYRIRAYTQWMRNAPEALFFSQDIAIGNGIIPAAVNKPDIDYAIDVQFFPEGGKLVKGIPVKIAVRAINTHRVGEVITGTLMTEMGETTPFKTNNLGLGSFLFNPISTARQKVSITFSNGVQKEYNLPAIVESGYSLMLKNGSGQNRILQIYISADNLSKGSLSLVGQRNGKVYFSQQIPSAKQTVSVTIPEGNLPSGILQLSLLNSAGDPVCERFAFINHGHENVDLSITGLRESYSRRSLVELLIDPKQQGVEINGSFSVSVTNASIIEPDQENEANIFSSFLLNSDALEPINGPNRFLSNTSEDYLDLLMLTGTWRSTPLKSLVEVAKSAELFAAEKTMGISGTLTNNGKPLPNGKVTLVKSAGGFDMLSTTSDSNGRFRFDSLSFSDSTKLLVQARTAGDKKNVKILIDQLPGQKVTVREVSVWEKDMSKQLINYAKHTEEYYKEQAKRIPLSGVNQLKEVEITGNRAARDNNFVRKHLKSDQEFTSKELDSAVFLSQVLLGKIRGRFDNYDIILDGQPLLPAERTYFFIETDPRSLERVEAISSPHLLAIYQPRAIKPRPLLFVTTKKLGTYDNVKYAPGVTTLTPKGFSYSRTFQSPDHSVNSDPRPDLRPTVYWNPNIPVNENGKLEIKYFNTDQPGRYRIVIEGIGGNRGLARKEIYYEVK